MMTPRDVLERHEPEPCYVNDGFEGFECAYCSPRGLLVFPLPDWSAFATHLVARLAEEVTR